MISNLIIYILPSFRRDNPVMVDELVKQGQLALDNNEPELAFKFFQRALAAAPEDTNIMDALADVQLLLGRADDARVLLVTSTTLAPTTNPFKWLFLAQLQRGAESVRSYQQAITLLSGLREPAVSSIQKHVTRAHVAIAELYLTDLCYDDGAEQLCYDALTKALEMEAGSLDALQCLASLRLSQGNALEACSIMQTVFERVLTLRETVSSRSIMDDLNVKSYSADDPDEMLESEFCVQTAKLLVECAAASADFADRALVLCSDLLEEDDDNIEVWYIAGVAALSCSPVDRDGALYHLSHARDMILAMRETGASHGTEEQYDLIMNHLEILEQIDKNALSLSGSGGDSTQLMEEEEWSEHES